MENLKNDSVSEQVGARDLLWDAMARHQEGRLVEADDLYARVLQLQPRNAQALRLRGILARQRGDLAASVGLLSHAAEVVPENPAPLAELALSHMATGDLQSADAAFRRALDRDPDSRNALANLGVLLHRRGHLHEALSFYRRYLALEPADLEVRCNLATALVDAGDGEEALVECDAALTTAANHPALLATRGAVLCGMERFQLAAEVLERAVAGNPGDAMAMINLGYARSKLAQPDAASRALRRALAVSPDNARATADLAGVMMAVDETADAVLICERFLARHPGERLVLATYAFALRDAGHEEVARGILDFDKLIKIVDVDAPSEYASRMEFNAEIATFIEGHPSIVDNPVSKATTDGRQTGELNLDETPAMSILADMVNAAVNTTTEQLRVAGFADHPVMAYAADTWTLRAWGVLLGAGGHQMPHLHPLAWLSGVYYARLPDDMQVAGPQAGWLEFGLPPERLVVKSPAEPRAVEPREGRLVLFPSYFYHRTQPFESDRSRISIAFDVMPNVR